MNIQLHTITTLPVHIPNRGSDGLAKRGVYAGIERQRISYQAQQYGLRHAPEFYAVEAAAELDSTKRTALVADRLLLPAFQEADINDAPAWVDAVRALWRKKNDKNNSGDEAGNEKAVPLIVGEQEIRLLTAVVKACAADDIKPAKLRDLVEKHLPKDTTEGVHEALDALKAELGPTKQTALVADRLLPAFQEADINDAPKWVEAVMELWCKKKDKDNPGDEAGHEKAVPLIVKVVKACEADNIKPAKFRDLVENRVSKRVRTALEALKNARGAVGTDGALFGRMATGVAVGTVDRCVRFSDALTTHGITPVADFFLTTDDLKDRDAGEAGGSHINSREMSAGVFYRHVVIDTAQMERNGLPPTVVEPLVDALLRVSPIGNRAPARTVDALVEVGGQVRSLMDAFACPVSAPADAVSRLRQFAQNDYDTYGIPKATLWLSDQSPIRVSSLARATAAAAGREDTAVETA